MIHSVLPILAISVLLYSCNGQQNIPQTPTTNSPQLGTIVNKLDPTIWNIFQDQQSNYWFGSKNKGVYRYDGKELVQFTTEDGLVDNDIRGIQEDKAGNVFIETLVGVSKFDGQVFQTLPIKKDAPNQWELNPDDLWFRIGFDNNGPYRYDGTHLHSLKLPISPQENAFYFNRPMASFSPYGIYSIYKDHTGKMWFGTTAIGVCRYDGKAFQWHYEKQLQTTPNGGDFGTRAILQDKDGFFWFNNTRYRYEILTNTSSNLLHPIQHEGIGVADGNDEVAYPFFLSIAEDKEGDLWMVTYDNGVWRKTDDKLVHYPIKDGNTDVMLFTIYKDRDGVLWLGTHNAGIYKYNGKNFEKFEFQ